MSILRRLLEINSNTPRVKEAIGFNPVNVGLIEGDGVAYGLSYQDNGNGSSKVKLLISSLYQSKTYEEDTDISVANEFKDQLSLTLIEDSAEIDKVGIIFPEGEISKKGEKYVKGLSFNTYGIKQSVNTPSVEHLGKAKLQKNINSNNFANRGNSYSQPKAVQVDNGDVIIIAHNLKDQTLVSWYLKSNESGKFKALPGKTGVIERKLFKFGNPGQLALNRDTMLYMQMSKRITEEYQEVVTTNIFKFDVTEVVENLKNGKGIDECLLSKKNCQINKVPSFSSEYEISFLQYVKQIDGNDLVAFLAEDRLSNKQMLHLTSLVKNGSKSNFTVCEFEDSIKQLYVKDDGQDGFIVTAVSEENIAIFNYQRFEKPSKVTIIPASSIQTLSNFVSIINGRLTPGIISSSTVAPITVAETVVTSGKASTAMITSTATDAVETTKLTTAASTTVAPTSTMSKPSTELTTQTSTVKSTTVEPTTAAKTTVTSQATTITERVTTSTNAPIVTSGTETSTVKPTAATVASTSTVSKPSTESTTQTSTVRSTTVEPTTAAKTTVTSQATTITERVTTSTNAPTTSSEKTTRTVFTIPSTRTKESTTPMFTTTLFPQPTSSPQPTQLAIGSNKAGMIGGSLVGVMGVVGVIGFIAYKCVKKHRSYNVAPMLELTDLESHSNSSNEELFTTNSRASSNDNISMRIMHQSETVLNSISVESSSRSRSSSSSSSSV